MKDSCPVKNVHQVMQITTLVKIIVYPVNPGSLQKIMVPFTVSLAPLATMKTVTLPQPVKHVK
jgi:hypothetical protein